MVYVKAMQSLIDLLSEEIEVPKGVKILIHPIAAGKTSLYTHLRERLQRLEQVGSDVQSDSPPNYLLNADDVVVECVEEERLIGSLLEYDKTPIAKLMPKTRLSCARYLGMLGTIYAQRSDYTEWNDLNFRQVSDEAECRVKLAQNSVFRFEDSNEFTEEEDHKAFGRALEEIKSFVESSKSFGTYYASMAKKIYAAVEVFEGMENKPNRSR